jgi:DNA processing protein
MSACRACLRRSHLVGHLAPRIAEVLRRPLGRTREVLALEDSDLIAALGGGRAAAARQLVETFDRRAAIAELERLAIDAVCRHDRCYPVALRSLPDAPGTLFVTGGLERFKSSTARTMACVVGTRRPSSYGLEVAQELGRGLAAAGVTVVSGLALGIDAAAHRGALEGGGRPIAVLACGVDRVYPRANRSLYQRVRERGTVISELPPGHPPFRWSFPARNRIMAGLSAITVVVEAADRSGSLITADFAHDLGREVGAVPGWVTSRMASGSNRLLREGGAAVIRGVGDVLDDLYGAGVRPYGALSRREGAAAQLEPRLRRVLDGIEAGEAIEAVARGAGMTAAATRAALGRLESLGLVIHEGLGTYRRAARSQPEPIAAGSGPGRPMSGSYPSRPPHAI